jgi:hypothetical protein
MPVQTPEESLAGLLGPAYEKAAFRVNRGRPLVFVCGGNSSNRTLRHQFLRHIPKRSLPVLPVLAERAFPHQLIERNIQNFEASIAQAADCVLIFVESVGSFAETGLFSALPAIREKTLVVNTRKESRANSFLNKGPIKLIGKKSKFEEVFILDKKKVSRTNTKKIVGRITASLPKYENSLVFHPEEKFSELNLRLQLACVYIAVRLVQAGSLDLFTSVLRVQFKAVDKEHVERYLAILVSLELIKRQDDLYYSLHPPTFQNDPLVSRTDFDATQMRARILEWHSTNSSQTATFLRGRGRAI